MILTTGSHGKTYGGVLEACISILQVQGVPNLPLLGGGRIDILPKVGDSHCWKDVVWSSDVLFYFVIDVDIANKVLTLPALVGNNWDSVEKSTNPFLLFAFTVDASEVSEFCFLVGNNFLGPFWTRPLFYTVSVIKQDHLRMNNNTGSNNHLRSKDLFRSMII